eukprot:CAMPEP_0176465486 /NCGR_PEP_ID=MMETSP0127-20121128/37288_1 /TAXON_ID=938130 /ORGANISM="Platyophrya macrostoma, Strain WH" /LENGTH=74 /DNA_ID=CAMNT_0017858397 /DNA_START=48 /DNA_END=268 /DNA_ORIENTATION=+
MCRPQPPPARRVHPQLAGRTNGLLLQGLAQAASTARPACTATLPSAFRAGPPQASSRSRSPTPSSRTPTQPSPA